MLKDFTLPSLFGCTSAVCSVETAVSLQFALADFSPLMTADPAEIRERQKLFRDLSSDPELVARLQKAAEKLKGLAELARKIGGVQGHSNEELLYALVELGSFVDIIELLDEAYAAAESLKSDRLLEFFRCIRSLTDATRRRAPRLSTSPA